MYITLAFSHNREEVISVKKVVFLMLVLFISMNEPVHSKAEEQELSAECKKMLEETKAEYINLVNNDVLSSFDLLDKEPVVYFTASELWKNEILSGKNGVFDSLKKLMTGKYRGEKRLYFFEPDPKIGYILFKDINNNNIMLTIEKESDKWILKEETVKEGKEISLETAKCNDQHFMQKMFDNLYP